MQRRDPIARLTVPMHQILTVKGLELPLKDVSTFSSKEGSQLTCGRGPFPESFQGFQRQVLAR